VISAENFYTFIQLGHFRSPGRPEILAHRARAAAGLAYCTGLWLPEIMALRRRHWCPDTLPFVVVDGDRVDGQPGLQSHPRAVPVSPAARYLVGQFLACFGGPVADPETRFFAIEDAPPLKLEIRNAARRSGIVPEIRPGDLRASFEAFVVGRNPNDPLAFYLAGRAPAPDMRDVFEEVDPEMRDLAGLLSRCHDVYDEDARLWNRERRLAISG
jgi:hypothetical protein